MFSKKNEPTCIDLSDDQVVQIKKMLDGYQQFAVALLSDEGKSLNPGILDTIIEGLWANKRSGEPAIMDDERLSWLLGSALGFYMTKTGMGRWVNYKDDHGDEIAILDSRGGVSFPIDMVKKRLLQDLGREGNSLAAAIVKIRSVQKSV